MRTLLRSMGLLAALLIAAPAFAQAPTPVQIVPPPANGPILTAISSTAAVNTATVLTIPAPPGGQYNYVCYLAFEINSDATGGALSNVVSTSTNFNSFAVKVSFPATVSIDGGIQTALAGAVPAGSCVKSASPGVATTFTAPASSTHIAWTWYASYFQWF